MRPLQGRRKNGEPLNVGASPYAIICAPYRGMCPRHVPNTGRVMCSRHVSNTGRGMCSRHVFNTSRGMCSRHVSNTSRDMCSRHVSNTSRGICSMRTCLQEPKYLIYRIFVHVLWIGNPCFVAGRHCPYRFRPQKRSSRKNGRRRKVCSGLAAGIVRQCGKYASATPATSCGNVPDMLSQKTPRRRPAKTAGKQWRPGVWPCTPSR